MNTRKEKLKIVITAGGTSEAIDQVRKITNSASGKLGMTIANELLQEYKEQVEQIYYICTKDAFRPKSDKVKVLEIVNTKDLQTTVRSVLKSEKIDYFIHSMAVSDYTVDYVTTSEQLASAIQGELKIANGKKQEKELEFTTNHGEAKKEGMRVIRVEETSKEIEAAINHNPNQMKDNKISSNEENLIIKLKPSPKIISEIKTISPQTFLIGFKLLVGVSEEKLIDVAMKQLQKNSCNLVVANDLEKIRMGNHEALILDKKQQIIRASGKEEIAKKLVSKMLECEV